MQRIVAFPTRLLMLTLLIGALGACSGGGGGSDDPPANQPPVLNAIGAQTVEEAGQLSFTVTASDAESMPTLSAASLPSGATFNASTGMFNWSTDAGDAAGSPYSVTFTATDSGGLTDTETVAITVNLPPNQTPVLDPVGDKTVEASQPLNFTVTASDDGLSPILSASNLPAGATFDAATGAFAWTPADSDVANSPFAVTFTATDTVDSSLTDEETISITVAPVCTVGVTAPTMGHLQTSGDLAVDATLDCGAAIPTGWGVKLAVDDGAGNSAEQVIADSASFNHTFPGLAQADYSLRAVLVDDAGNEISGAATEVMVTPVGIGDYYVAMGDSITTGRGDDITSDDTSADGRNSGGGYPPILNDRLTAALGYPHTVITDGVEGTTSSEGLTAVPGVLAGNPDAQRILVKYGMNDAGPPLPVPSGLGLSSGESGYDGSFKDNMQRIVNAVNNDGKEVVLAKINIALGESADGPTCGSDPEQCIRSIQIVEYNQVIDELVNDTNNNINITPPDFFELFLTDMRYESEYDDNIHPNGTGYQSMADRWTQVLTQ